LEYHPDIPYANTSDQHDFYHVFNPWKGSFVGAFMIAYKLAAAIFAEIILFPLVLFPFLVMFGLWQWGI
jgi:hypothetical protein